MFNKIIDYRKFPQDLLLSRITPIPKKGKNKHNFDSYRGVSVQSNLLRFFETIILRKINPFIMKHNLIPKQQNGYKKHISISNQHIDIQNIIFENLNDKNVLCVDLIFLDLSNAFDCIPHEKLIDTLKVKGISGDYLKIISDSLMNRRQFVKYDNLYSMPNSVNSGVAQGGVLSPILYNIYVSDINKYLNCIFFQWADDSVLLSVIKSPKDSVELQNNIKMFEKFCLEKYLKLNETKTKHLRIGFKKYDFKYVLKNKIIETIASHKHLGVFYDSKMQFNYHCSEIIRKSFSKFNFLKFVCRKSDGKTFLSLYKAYILPIIEYSNACWVPNNSQMNNLEKIQRKITKHICFKLGETDLNYSQRLEFLNLESLKNRREKSALKLVFRIKFNSPVIPNHWFSYFDFYSTRNGIKLKTEFRRIELINKKYFNYCIELFNSQPFMLRQSSNFNFL